MRLEPGITCIVGPNGSGKSNVVDALAWVMGEQGLRACVAARWKMSFLLARPDALRWAELKCRSPSTTPMVHCRSTTRSHHHPHHVP
nr:AAA family ATPase [Ornithinimicrobium sp. INDO-MA30-4]